MRYAKLTKALLALLVLWATFIPSSAAEDLCKASPEHPIQVCFKPPQFLRCKRRIRAPFIVDFNDWTDKVYYSVNIYKGEPKLENLRYNHKSPVPLKARVPPQDLQDFPIDLPDDRASNGEYIVEVEVEDVSASLKTTERLSVPVNYQRHVLAIVVGVSRYKYGADKPTQLFPIANLNFAADDATDFNKFLAEFFPQSDDEKFTSYPFINETATKDNIKLALENAREPDAACENDLFIFYFSGHTFATTENPSRWLGTWDIDPDPTQLILHGFRYDELFDNYLALRLIKANKIVIFDSCFSGLKRTNSRDADEGSTKGGAIRKEQIAGDEGKLEVADAVTGQLRRDLSAPEVEQTEAMEYVMKLGSSAALFAATNIDRPAQEGVIVSPPENGRSFFFLDEHVKDQNASGHGLFTYALFVALEKQMPATHPHSDFAKDGLASSYWTTADGCELDLNSAYLHAIDVITGIQQVRKRPLQEPNTWATQNPDRIRCKPSQKQ